MCGSEMKETKNNKCLGCVLAPTASESVRDTVASRVGLAKRSVYEIRTIIEDIRAKSLGSIEDGLHIWETSIIPMLLYSSEVWADISPKVIKILDDVSSLFLTNLFGVSRRGCPTVSLYLQTSTFKMEIKILLRKLIFYHHVMTLPEESLTRNFADEMKRNEYPGLVNECETVFNEWKISNVHSYSKLSWKRKIKERIEEIAYYRDIISRRSQRYG